MIFRYGVYCLDIDAEKTRQFYENHVYESCSCAGCRNFAGAYHLLPEEFLRFVRQFGVDPGKPAEITAYSSLDGNLTFYDGFYHICGKIIEGKEPYLRTGERTYQLDEQYLINIREDVPVFFKEQCALIDKDFPRPVIQIEFQCSVPWVLDEPNPYFYP